MRKHIRSSGSSLIGLLLVTFIVLIAAWLYLKPVKAGLTATSPGLGSSDSAGISAGDAASLQTSRPEQAIQKARSAQVVAREQRVKLAEDQFRIMEGRDPATPQELVDKGLLEATDINQ